MNGILPILYQDAHLVVIDKPAGLLVHRMEKSTDRVFALQLLRDQLGRSVYPVHRLDRPTCGVLLFAFSPEMAARLIEDFTAHRIRKRYLAVVRGLTEEEGVIDHPLREDKAAPSQECRTAYRRLATVELAVPVGPHPTARYSLVEAEPLTGRMHQLRRHLKHVAHPVIGDTQYGDSRHNLFFRERLNTDRLLLMARRLELRHPGTGEELHVEAPLPADMAALFALFGWR